MAELLGRIKKGGYSFPSPAWDGISDGAKRLVSLMLATDPEARLSAVVVLEVAKAWEERGQVPSGTYLTEEAAETAMNQANQMLAAKRLQSAIPSQESGTWEVLQPQQHHTGGYSVRFDDIAQVEQSESGGITVRFDSDGGKGAG